MKIDLNTYSINRKYIQNWYKHNKDKVSGVVEAVALQAPSIHCPCIVLTYFIAEDIGFTEEIVESIESLIKQYGYKEILNQPENSPLDKYGKRVV